MKDKNRILDKIKRNKNEKINDANIENNKGNKLYFYSLIVIIILLLVVIAIIVNNKFDVNNDSVKFKEEYELLNNQDTGYGKQYKKLNISKDNPIVYTTFDEIFDILEDGTGVIYFGFPECPWCRALLPELLTAAENVGIEKIYYLNCKEDRDIKKLDDDGNVITEKQGTPNYYKLIEKLGKYFWTYDGLNDESIKRLYFPTVVIVKDGEVKDIHIDVLDGLDDPYRDLTKNEKTKLQGILEEKLQKIIVCDKNGC